MAFCIHKIKSKSKYQETMSSDTAVQNVFTLVNPSQVNQEVESLKTVISRLEARIAKATREQLEKLKGDLALQKKELKELPFLIRDSHKDKLDMLEKTVLTLEERVSEATQLNEHYKDLEEFRDALKRLDRYNTFGATVFEILKVKFLEEELAKCKQQLNELTTLSDTSFSLTTSPTFSVDEKTFYLAASYLKMHLVDHNQVKVMRELIAEYLGIAELLLLSNSMEESELLQAINKRYDDNRDLIEFAVVLKDQSDPDILITFIRHFIDYTDLEKMNLFVKAIDTVTLSRIARIIISGGMKGEEEEKNRLFMRALMKKLYPNR